MVFESSMFLCYTLGGGGQFPGHFKSWVQVPPTWTQLRFPAATQYLQGMTLRTKQSHLGSECCSGRGLLFSPPPSHFLCQNSAGGGVISPFLLLRMRYFVNMEQQKQGTQSQLFLKSEGLLWLLDLASFMTNHTRCFLGLMYSPSFLLAWIQFMKDFWQIVVCCYVQITNWFKLFFINWFSKNNRKWSALIANKSFSNCWCVKGGSFSWPASPEDPPCANQEWFASLLIYCPDWIICIC